MRILPLSLSFVLAAALAAQETVSPMRFVPADAVAVIRCAGPGAWRAQFAETRIAKLLRGPTLGPLVEQLGAEVDKLLAKARESGKVDADVLEKALHEYAGEIAVAITIDFAAVPAAMENDSPPPFGVVIAFGPDGKTDLKKLAEDTRKAAEEKGGLTDLKVGDQVLRVHTEGDVATALPFELDGWQVMMVGSQLERQATALFAGKDRFEPPALALQGPLAVHVAAEQGLAVLFEALTAKAVEDGVPFDVEALLAQLGFPALRGLDLVVGSDGEHAAVEMRLSFNDKERGLLAALTPAIKPPPVTMGYVPTGAEVFSITPLDFGALYRTIAGVWDQVEDQVPMPRRDAEAAFAEACKVRLKEDLLDHVGTELLVVGDDVPPDEPDEDADDPFAAAMAAAQGCFALHLKDGKAFGENIEKLLRARGLHAARKSEEYRGTKVSQLKLGLFELEYAVTADLLLLALGKDDSAHKSLRGVLDEAADRAAGRKPAEQPEAIKSRLARMPGGWQGVGATPPYTMFAAMVGGLRGAARGGGLPLGEDRLEALEKSLEKMRSDLQQFGLETMVSTQHIEPAAIAYRMRW
jgi:hypothetical protein